MKYLSAIVVNLVFVSNAFAMGGAPSGGKEGGGLLGLFLPMIIVFGIFYLLLIRPQQKQQKKTKGMLEAMQRGDEVVTRGGIHGRIDGIDGGVITLEIANNIKIKINKEYIGAVKGKEEPAKK
jgi:preprotein translocase subunit YajC